MFAAMGGMVIVSLSIPEAFGDRGVLFGCSYFFVRAMQLVLYVRSTRREGDAYNLEAILRLAPGLLLGSAMLIVAGLLDGGARTSVWILAILIDWSTPLLFGSEEFRLHPGHFAERYGLIVMIALGESVLATGAEMNFALNAGEVTAALLGIAAVAALWWAYFDIVAIVAERRLIEAPPGEQAPLARDAYSYLHYPMIAGIVLLAVGLRETLAHVERAARHGAGRRALWRDGALPGGAHRIPPQDPRHLQLSPRPRHPGPAGADSRLPWELTRWWPSAAVTAVLIVLIAYEAVHFHGARARVRANPSASLAEMRGS